MGHNDLYRDLVTLFSEHVCPDPGCPFRITGQLDPEGECHITQMSWPALKFQYWALVNTIRTLLLIHGEE